jgi:hypothetical protein
MDKSEITVENIKKAATDLGLKIANGTCYSPGLNCGCPLFILSANKVGIEVMADLFGDMPDVFSKTLDLSRYFVAGFIDGFDGHNKNHRNGGADYIDGYTKGSEMLNKLNMELAF